MKPKNNRCEEHGMYLYRTGFGWSCKLGCYYCDDPQKIKEEHIQQYKKELKDKINKLKKEVKYHKGDDITDSILELLKEEIK